MGLPAHRTQNSIRLSLGAGNTAEQIPLGAVRAGGVVSFTTMGPDEATLDAAPLTGRKVMVSAVRETTGPIAEMVAPDSTPSERPRQTAT